MAEHAPPGPDGDLRLRRRNEAPVAADGDYVLYWMVASRRSNWNHALDRALAWCRALGRPLVVLEALRCDYRWASDRLHRFVLDGMRDNAAAFDRAGVTYFPYVEPSVGAGRGLLESLARSAAVVVTDEFPCFFLPRMVDAAANRLTVRLESVDSNGLLPLRAPGKAFSRAFDFRRYLQSSLLDHLDDLPAAEPFRGLDLPPAAGPSREIVDRWPAATLESPERLVSDLPIDHTVAATDLRGGSRAATERLDAFLENRLSGYLERNQPESETTSGLSPYLHFGHVSAHQVFSALTEREGWTPDRTAPTADGKRQGWWGLSPAAEGYLDQLVTWRELGYVFCYERPDYDELSSLPSWARATLEEHANDPRPELYDLDEFDHAATHDPIWNAAQTELRESGRMHNYLRMLWGKKILHWSDSPASALRIMIELNNRYALDGRNPNSYSGIFWTLGRFDRAWGPERPVFGKVRYMTSESTRRKLRLNAYLRRWGESREIDG